MRKQVKLTPPTVREFVQALNADPNKDMWHFENESGDDIVNARSLLGSIWAMDYWDVVYIVNDTHPGEYCDFMYKYFNEKGE